MSYYRPTQSLEINQIIKKSQFIGQVSMVTSANQAAEFIQQVKTTHSKANHSCHCFIAGTPEQSSLWGYSDDGEPKGTAGMPMFQVLKHSGLGNICVVVTRYFGGIKLGTGGIARAYSSTVNLTLQDCKIQLVHITCSRKLSIPFQLTGVLEHIIKQFPGVSIINREWQVAGQTLSLRIEEPTLQDFLTALSPYHHEIQMSS